MNFDALSLCAHLATLLPGNGEEGDRGGDGESGRLIVALSGGLDSSVLLHAMRQIRTQFPRYTLEALHVNHGLSPNAAAWQSFCEQTCAALGIPLHVEIVQVNRTIASLESAARDARYNAFARCLNAGDCLLLAHHGDDQAETFLLRTLRGAGPRGLAAMPVSRPVGSGILLRPLLPFSRDALVHWARDQCLTWVNDESNDSTGYDRNFCRLEVLPRIAERWPGYRESWARSASLSAETSTLLDDLAVLDYASVRTTDRAVIDGNGLMTFSEARQRNLLRYWLQMAGASEPGWNILNRIVSEVLGTASNAQPELRWGTEPGVTILKRHKGMLCLSRSDSGPVLAAVHAWHPPGKLQLPDNGTVHAVRAAKGLRIREGELFTLRYRKGGEICCLQGRRTRPLKKILQESGMAPWRRELLPLVYAGDALVYIPGVGVCEGWQARDSEPAWEIVWSPPEEAGPGSHSAHTHGAQ